MDGFFALFGGGASSQQQQQQQQQNKDAPSPAPSSTCPVVGATTATSPSPSPSPTASSAALAAQQQQQQQQDQQHAARINMPVVPNDAGALDPKIARLLSTQRAASTIPMSADAAAAPPRHQQPQEAQPSDKRAGGGWGAWVSRSSSGNKKQEQQQQQQQADDRPPSNPDASSPVWMYPSEAQFFAAMRRKGWDPRPEDMANVVRIHNAVNERAWMHVLEWEERRRQGGEAAAGPATPQRLCACCGRAECAGAGDEVRLKRFVGRPTDLSPKARMLNLLGYKLPFDRHDWVVERCCGGGGGDEGESGGDRSEEQQQQQQRRCVEARYVIDFYSGRSLIPGVPAVHLDVRPALDSPSAAWQRATALGAALADAAAAGLGLSPSRPASVSADRGSIEQVQRILSQQQR